MIAIKCETLVLIGTQILHLTFNNNCIKGNVKRFEKVFFSQKWLQHFVFFLTFYSFRYFQYIQYGANHVLLLWIKELEQFNYLF